MKQARRKLAIAGKKKRTDSKVSRLFELPECAVVDGKRVVIRGADEIVLECGEASITLRRNGRIVIKGTFLESYSKGLNRIKGVAVKID
jgi:hypothetical protein